MSKLYASTNESLDAIMAGMDLNKNDCVLSVLGSGDQAFAMLEYGCRVVAVERGFSQSRFAMEMADAIREGDTKMFLSDYSYEFGIERRDRKRNSYFSKPCRIEMIRQNLGRLEMRHGDILELPEAGIFSKVYLSNVPGYDMTIESVKKAEGFMAGLAARLRQPGIVYISGKNQGIIAPGSLPIIHDRSIRISYDFEVDEALTQKALAEEKSAIPWFPFVLRRRA